MYFSINSKSTQCRKLAPVTSTDCPANSPKLKLIKNKLKVLK